MHHNIYLLTVCIYLHSFMYSLLYLFIVFILCSFLRAYYFFKFLNYPIFHILLEFGVNGKVKNFIVQGNLSIRANICFMFSGSSSLILSKHLVW